MGGRLFGVKVVFKQPFLLLISTHASFIQKFRHVFFILFTFLGDYIVRCERFSATTCSQRMELHKIAPDTALSTKFAIKTWRCTYFEISSLPFFFYIFNKNLKYLFVFTIIYWFFFLFFLFFYFFYYNNFTVYKFINIWMFCYEQVLKTLCVINPFLNFHV